MTETAYKSQLITYQLKLKKDKIYHVTFTRISNDNFNSQYFLGAERIAKCTEIKDLRIISDSKLTFTPHIDALVTRINKF